MLPLVSTFLEESYVSVACVTLLIVMVKGPVPATFLKFTYSRTSSLEDFEVCIAGVRCTAAHFGNSHLEFSLGLPRGGKSPLVTTVVCSGSGKC